ncbi:MAG: FHA domain-containing protein [Deltaproteobacteria bacterium]|nr:FHA domain-containing protein [Deltaproteobacteria bacterium]
MSPNATKVTIIMGGPTRPQILIRQSQLTVTSGPDLGVEHTFDGSRFIFGTDESCVFRLTDPDVSRVHCSLDLHRDAVRIRDLESSNGTFVNGVKVIEAELQSGDRIQIGNTSISFQVDVRVVAATNRDLAAEVGRDHFRQDLFYRLNVIQVNLPPLRDRPEDIVFLARTFLRRLLGRLPDDSLSDYLSPQAVEQIRSHAWPGNIRELFNHVQRMVTLSQPDLRPMNANLGDARPETGRSEDGPQGAGLPSTSGRGKVPTLSGSAPAPTLDARVASTPRGTSRPQVGDGPGVGSTPESDAATDDQVPADLLGQPFKPAKEEWTSRFERRYLEHLVEKTHGNISAAARMAQVDRAYLYKLLRRYDLLDTNG